MDGPDFFVIGAAKSGTTSLYEFLNAHPDVCMSSVKEPNFFSYKEIEQQKLYYKVKNIKTVESYARLFGDCKPGQIKGEASVSYIFYPRTASLIKEFAPEARIIAILRNPMQRAVSHYNMDRNLGLVKLKLREVFTEPDRYPLYFQQYFELGNYHTHLKKYFEIFHKDRIAVFLYDELIDHEARLAERLCSFLQIQPPQSDTPIQASNITSRPKSRLLQDLYSSATLRKGLKRLIPESTKSRIVDTFFERNPVDKLSMEFESEISAYYKSEISQLEDLIGRDLKNWKK